MLLDRSDLDGKSRYGRRGKSCIGFFESDACDLVRPRCVLFIELVRVRAVSDFERLEAELIMILADDGKRAPLTQMLSYRCPEWIDSGFSTEFTLAALGEQRLQDGILLLCDAFDKANSEPNRKTI